jgi:hypothetical protein
MDYPGTVAALAMSLTTADLRNAIDWNAEYHPEWDNTPERYEQAGIVGWGKSRRLGIYRNGPIKAYIGLQHVDTSKHGWNIADEPYTRFFISLFVNNRVVTLRTFPAIDATLDFLLASTRSI